MPALLNGSPTHALIVHVVVVLLPLSVLGALVLVFVPRARRPYGVFTLVVAFAACIAVPLAFASGGALRERVPSSSLIDHHVSVAHQLLPVAAVFGVVLAGFVFIDILRRERRGDLNRVESAIVSRVTNGNGTAVRRDLSRPHQVAAALLVIVSIVTAVAVVRTGDSGAKATWHDRVLPAGSSHHANQ
jgi:uncharacterized membrane protein